MWKRVNFLNCKIDLSKKVFEPRIETEFWVGKALDELRIKNYELRVLDIFAGTGCIGITFLKNIKNARVDFADISQKAIKQIKANLKLNKISKEKYRIFKSNLFEKIRNNKYDIIFANPPYVALDRISQVQKEVLRKEPPTALFAGKDGMYWIERFLKQVKKYLSRKGVIYLEFDPLQKEKIRKILEKEGFKFQFRKDQFKKYRWLIISF